MRTLAPLLLLTACAGLGTVKTDGAGETGDSADVTWYEDIEPLVAEHCASCHGPDGVAGLDLTDPSIAMERAELMLGMVSSGLMPPPAADPTCRPYDNADAFNIDADELALLQAWVDEGAALGRPEDAPPPADLALRITDPDLTLTMPFAYTPDLDGDGNQYWCVTLDNTLTETAWITGLDVDLGNTAVVHHMLLLKDTGGDAGEAYGISDPSAGFDCRSPMMEDDWTILHAWAPGMGATMLPEGTGMALAPGDQIVLQMHYFSSSDQAPAPDQSSYLLKLSSQAPDETIEVYPIGPTGFRIPADEADYEIHEELDWNYPLTITIYGVFPHQHVLGKRYESWIDHNDGTIDCLARGDWDFHHQAFYMYDEPTTLEMGDTLAGGCTWDNSADNPDQYNDPPEDVYYGEGTNQEMCYFLFYLSY